MEALSAINFLLAALSRHATAIRRCFWARGCCASGGPSRRANCAGTRCSSLPATRAPSSPSCWRASGSRTIPRTCWTFMWWRTTAPTAQPLLPESMARGCLSGRTRCRWARATPWLSCWSTFGRTSPRSATTATSSSTRTTCWTPTTSRR